MPRPAAPDVFAAIAEPRRRDLVAALAGAGPRPVNDLVAAVRLPQPAVSKHLAVLREAGIVSVQRRGRQRLYTLNAEGLRPIHAWVGRFERFWDRHLARIRARAERQAHHQPPTRPAKEK
ncbi:MAG: metalloregulator ArsR/SmtB family transcription factor [Phycisphaerales bacterium]